MSCTVPPVTITSGDPFQKTFTLSQCPAGWNGILPLNVTKDGYCTTTGYSYDTNPKASALPVCTDKTAYVSCPGADFTSYAQTTNQRPNKDIKGRGVAAGICILPEDGTPLVAPGCDAKKQPTGCLYFTKSQTDTTPTQSPPESAYDCSVDTKAGYACSLDRFVCDKRYGVCRNASVLNSPAFAYIPADSPVQKYADCAAACVAGAYSCSAGGSGSYSCVLDPQGTMTYTECTTDSTKAPQCAQAGPGDRWACDADKGCAKSSGGPYATLSACQNACKSRCNAQSGTCSMSDDPNRKAYADAAGCSASCKPDGLPVSTIVIIVVCCVVGIVLVGLLISWLRHRSTRQAQAAQQQ